MASPVTSLESVLSTGRSDPSAVVYRRVRVRGTYDAGREVLVRNRALDGAPGEWILTPLVTGPGRAVVVNRGWVPFDTKGRVVRAEAAPPRGPVTVVGLLLPTQRRGRLGPRDPATGTLSELNRPDLDRLRAQLPYEIYPAYVELSSQQPAQSQGLPRLIPPPELGEGPHLSYAIQWFSFAAIGLIGWPVLVRRRAGTDTDDDPDGTVTPPSTRRRRQRTP
jgi:surfeit locus 1 family protein